MDSNRISPGIFNICSYIAHQYDAISLQTREKMYYRVVQEEDKVVYNIVSNIIALIKFNLPTKLQEAKGILEDIRHVSPNNLNNLANLEYMYSYLHLKSQAEDCKECINQILNGNSQEDSKERAICLLEQGYVHLFEKEFDPIEIAHMKLKETHSILCRESLVDGKDVRQVRDPVERVCKKADIFVDRINNDKDQRQIEKCVRKFKKGLQILQESNCSDQDVILWKYYLAIACYKLYECLDATGESDATFKLMDETCRNFLDIFNSVINNLNVENVRNKLYVARSKAYIASFFGCKFANERFRQYISNNYFEFTVIDPVEFLEDAKTLKQHDKVVVVKHINTLLSYQKRKPNNKRAKQEKMKELEEVEKSLNVIMNQLDEISLYETRMDVYFEMGKLSMDRKDRLMHWDNACHDGRETCRQRESIVCLSKLARILQCHAKNTSNSQFGPKYIKISKNHNAERCLNEAIEYLNYSLRIGGSVSYDVVYLLGTCLFDKGEYRNAIEWMKRAIMLAREKDGTESLTLTCEFLFEFFNLKKEKDTPLKKCNYLMQEIIILFHIAQDKFSNESLAKGINSLTKRNYNLVSKLVDYFFISKQVTKPRYRKTFQMCIESFPDRTRQINEEKLRDYEAVNSEDQEEFKSVESLFETPEFPLPRSTSVTVNEDGYTYDFFVSYSSRDSDWVECFLLKQLETKLDNNVPFKGCYADRDFIPGKSIIDNIIEAIGTSYKILLILTPNFIESSWCDYEVNHVLRESLDEKERKECVVPILLDPQCKVPKKLQCINYLDLSTPSTYVNGLIKLKTILIRNE